jgi:hypothetical protein
MKKTLSLLFLSISIICHAQNQISKILVDKNTKEPLRGATINNSIDHTITNDDGRFIFYSENDSIIIRMLGYNKLKTTFEELNSSVDTIYLKQSPIALNEVVVKDYKNIIFKTYNEIQKNHPHFSHSDKFFLRCILKRDNSIIKIEDVSGKIKRNSIFASREIPKLNFDFQLFNQRKLGLLKKDKKIEDFKLQTLENLFMWFSTVFINPNHFEFREERLADSSYAKVFFNPLKEYQNKSIGYYIINKKDKAIKEYYSKTNPSFTDKIVFEEKQGYKWRTIDSELSISYDKIKKNDKYFISSGSLKQVIELFNRKNEKTVYEVEYNLIVTEPFYNIMNFNSNVRKNKELFKLDIEFDKNFWLNQNQLPLTNELNEFIKNIKTYEKEFKIISNF